MEKKKIIEVIEVTTPTCGQCKMIAPRVKRLMDSCIDIKFTEVDGTKDAELCAKYNINKVPVFIVKYNDGSETFLSDGNVFRLQKVLEL